MILSSTILAHSDMGTRTILRIAEYIKYSDINTETDPEWLKELARNGATSGTLRNIKKSPVKCYEAGLLSISKEQDDEIHSHQISGIPHLDIINTVQADMNKERQTKAARRLIGLIKFHVIYSFRNINDKISITPAEF